MKTMGGAGPAMAAAAAALRVSGCTNIDIDGCSRKMAGNTTTLGESIVMNVRTLARAA